MEPLPEPDASSSRSRDPLRFSSFDLPSGWGCRKSMVICKDEGTDMDAPNAAAAASEAKDSGPQSPVSGAAVALQALAVEEPAREAPQRQWNLRERTSGKAEDAWPGKKFRCTDSGGSRRFSVELTQEEIDADFIAMTGRKAPRRPTRKRTMSVQRQIETLCPGSLLEKTTPDRYKVKW